ncbi:MAG: hypothetical protein LBT26_06795, partial [Clostridiales Family XIII bacterium]|nr:hypothetical protein [Clostridiales Family XIII bacterium]
PVLRHGDAFSPGAGIGTSAGDASRLCYLFFGTFSKTLDTEKEDGCGFCCGFFDRISEEEDGETHYNKKHKKYKK